MPVVLHVAPCRAKLIASRWRPSQKTTWNGVLDKGLRCADSLPDSSHEFAEIAENDEVTSSMAQSLRN